MAIESFDQIFGLLKNGPSRQSFSRRLIFVLGAAVAYVLVASWLYAYIGDAVNFLVFFPVLIAGCLFGALGGIFFGLLAAVFNLMLIFGIEADHELFASQLVIGLHVFLIVLVGLAAGWVRDLRRDWRREKFYRHLAEFRESEKRYRGIFDHANDSILILHQGVVVDCNQRTLDLFDVDRSQFLGLTPYDFSPRYQPDGSLSEEKAQEKISSALAGEPQRFEWLHQRNDGETFMVEVILNRLDFPPEPHILATLRDITERKRSEQVQAAIYHISEAANSPIGLQELFATIHAILNDLIAAENMFIALYDAGENLITFPYFVDQFDSPPEPRQPSGGLTEFVLHTQRTQLITPERFDDLVEAGKVTNIGTPSVDWLGVPLKVEGHVIGVLGTQTYQPGVRFGKEERDIVSFVSDQVAMAVYRKRGEERLKYMSVHDTLTGLYNRAYFEEELARLERGRKFPVSVLIADLDGLKMINDRFGHAAGDDALCQAARILQGAFRAEDGLARIGGDEFAVLLPEVDRGEAEEIMERVRLSLAAYNQVSSGPLLNISIGCATCTAAGHAATQDSNSLQATMLLADEHMYQDKKRHQHADKHVDQHADKHVDGFTLP